MDHLAEVRALAISANAILAAVSTTRPHLVDTTLRARPRSQDSKGQWMTVVDWTVYRDGPPIWAVTLARTGLSHRGCRLIRMVGGRER